MKRFVVLSSLALVSAVAVAWVVKGAPAVAQPTKAKGFVYHDENGNRRRDPDEKGIPGVRVSDQTQIVVTDRNGYWEMPTEADNDTAYFVVKPRGWKPHVNAQQLPQFYYIHKPAGSPPNLRFPGVKPTGPLPASIDFALVKSEEPKAFEALFFGDTQPRNLREVDYIRRDIVEPIVGKHQAAFGVTLGDVVFDDLSVMEPLNQVIALIGIPWYNVLGNHDINYDVDTDDQSDETWERIYGPNYYSFDHGAVHFLVLDNVQWKREGERGAYSGGFGEKQLAWVKKDLERVPKNQLIVATMHIPLANTSDREAFFDLISDRPYTLSVSAHTHYQEHIFYGKEQGWKGKDKHHHVVNVTTCGSWWQGSPDEYGIPHATMRDGAPNGYAIFRFDGNQYQISYRAARRHDNYQMEIHSPAELEASAAAGTEILVNVFNGSERSKVEMKIGANGAWVPMEKVMKPDPAFAAMAEKDSGLTAPFRPLPNAINSPHMWSAKMPAVRTRGLIPVHVRTTDMHGQVSVASKGIVIK